MKLKMPLEDYIDLQRYVEQAVSEYGPALQRVIVSNDVRLKIFAGKRHRCQQSIDTGHRHYNRAIFTGR